MQDPIKAQGDFFKVNFRRSGQPGYIVRLERTARKGEQWAIVYEEKIDGLSTPRWNLSIMSQAEARRAVVAVRENGKPVKDESGRPHAAFAVIAHAWARGYRTTLNQKYRIKTRAKAHGFDLNMCDYETLRQFDCEDRLAARKPGEFAANVKRYGIGVAREACALIALSQGITTSYAFRLIKGVAREVTARAA